MKKTPMGFALILFSVLLALVLRGFGDVSHVSLFCTLFGLVGILTVFAGGGDYPRFKWTLRGFALLAFGTSVALSGLLNDFSENPKLLVLGLLLGIAGLATVAVGCSREP